MSANIEVPYFRVHPFYSRSPEVDYWQHRRIRWRSSVSGAYQALGILSFITYEARLPEPVSIKPMLGFD